MVITAHRAATDGRVPGVGLRDEAVVSIGRVCHLLIRDHWFGPVDWCGHRATSEGAIVGDILMAGWFPPGEGKNRVEVGRA
jgi:hypothetical protein